MAQDQPNLGGGPGSTNPANLFGNHLEANLRSCVKMVEAVMATFGVDPDANRIKTPNALPAWGLRRGSASIFVFLQTGEDANYIQIVSPVLRLPVEGREAFYRRMLELNASVLVGAAFGVRGEDVVITSDRNTTDLEAGEVAEMIRRVGGYADRYDDELAAEFSAGKLG